MRVDWFRKRSWSKQDQDEFQQRLARARESNRAQYIFIQGYTLMEADPQFGTAAIGLFDRVIDRYPNSIHLGPALSSKAQCLLNAGDLDGSLTFYRRAIEQRRALPSVDTWAWLDFAWIVATKGISEEYKAALDLLDEFGEPVQLFPVVVFRLNGSRALIWSALGLTDLAAKAARSALDAANKEVSGLRHHSGIGIVGSKFPDVRARLLAIACNAE